MKYLNKILLISFLSFNMIQSADNDPEKEYKECMKKAENKNLLIRRYLIYYQINEDDKAIATQDKLINNRYKKECNKCLAKYYFNRAVQFLKWLKK